MRRFLGDVSGNVALIFALCLIPMTMVVGASVDLSRMRSERTRLQGAVDSAALAVANLPLTTRDAEISDLADRMVAANFHGVGVIGEIRVERSPTGIGVHARSDVPMTFGAILGADTRPVTAFAEATRSFSNFEVVMVLDNSGSMGGAKLTALKSAAGALVDTLGAAAREEGSVKIGLVPFTLAVNVGPANANAAWMDRNAASAQHQGDLFDSAANRFALYGELGVAWAGCVETRPYPHDVRDTPAAAGSPSSLFVPFFAPDEPDGYSSSIYGNNYLEDWKDAWTQPPAPAMTCAPWLFGFYRCVSATGAIQYSLTDISQPGSGLAAVAKPSWANKDGSYSSSEKAAAQKYREKYRRNVRQTDLSLNDISGTGMGPNAGCTARPLQPMTTNFAALKTSINAMTANGSTNIHQGAMWGWRLLSPAAPFTEGAAYDDPDTRKFLILLTDGANSVPYTSSSSNHNRSPYSPYGFMRLSNGGAGRLGTVGNQTQTNQEVDDRTRETCANARAAGVIVYTIAFDVTANSNEARLMDDCASGADKYYLSPTAATLNATFEAIVNDITQLRLSR